jgi:hypothetical protein
LGGSILTKQILFGGHLVFQVITGRHQDVPLRLSKSRERQAASMLGSLDFIRSGSGEEA